jgi:hypothetical protein
MNSDQIYKFLLMGWKRELMEQFAAGRKGDDKDAP